MKPLLLLGDEAIAQAALDAGLSGVYAYPGTPSTEITEYIQHSPYSKQENIHCRWATNEKTAMDTAMGMSFAGKRSLVCMKHVGVNVAADPLMNSSISVIINKMKTIMIWILTGNNELIWWKITIVLRKCNEWEMDINYHI